MRLSVLCIGKLRDAHLAAVIAEFEQRAQRYWPLEVRELREESARGRTPDAVREKEAERLLGAVTDGAMLVACDALGREMTSEEFASWLQRERERASRDVAFVIGGAFGLAPRVTARAELRLAFSRWTLPHEMARLVLAEQLYRAGTLVRGEPYHK
ncbi:MAG TPA: 23S rRNA (pseudouridine(1915)-N(3))-methyltransferase RlmH [Gemmatimonadaceae bacterium]|jgi:23S rRNA (pseudouridine1915-N3)-methyltransferase|nr:23S rRNA (pseudouridine(1915)-N(3))-methyltransferase RlmH [Gemmatimonadaceae bacterium]